MFLSTLYSYLQDNVVVLLKSNRELGWNYTIRGSLSDVGLQSLFYNQCFTISQYVLTQ